MVQPYSALIPRGVPSIDEPFAVNAEFNNDCDERKVNLGIGVYRDNEGKPWALKSVTQAEELLRDRCAVDRHEYLTIQGDRQFLDLACNLAFDLTQEVDKSRIVSVQTVSGTGANHVGAKYLAEVLKPRCVWLPEPTWGNHPAIWNMVGVEVKYYPYFDNTKLSVDIQGILRTLTSKSQAGDVVLFHACAHNPTGSDLSQSQWLSLIELCEARKLVPLLDFAYQGFASGNVSQDALAVKCFFRRPRMEFCVAQSFSKNFGLYGQRAGALHVVVSQESSVFRDQVLASLCHIVRSEYSMAPRYGSDVVKTVLGNAKLRSQWTQDLQIMSGRISEMRQALYSELCEKRTPGSWTHIIEQIGMFSYTGLSEVQVMFIRKEYHIYMLRSGRISMSGVTCENVKYIATAIDAAVRASLRAKRPSNTNSIACTEVM